MIILSLWKLHALYTLASGENGNEGDLFKALLYVMEDRGEF